MKNPRDESRDKAITVLAACGWSQHRIARALHLTQPAISKAIRRLSPTTEAQNSADTPREPPAQGDNHDSAARPQRTPYVSQNVLLLAALHANVCFSFQQGMVVIELPPTLDATLTQALAHYSDSILRLIERVSAHRHACPRCGNRLLLSTPTGAICPHCHPQAGIEWIWATR